MNDETDVFKDALDAARFQSRMREQVEEECHYIPIPEDSGGEGYADTAAIAIDTPVEDDSDLAIEWDRWGRMIVKRNGKVTYWEGKNK